MVNPNAEVRESSPSKIEGDIGGVCQKEEKEEKKKSSPSKIDQWRKPNAEVRESSPSKIEGVGGSMKNSEL